MCVCVCVLLHFRFSSVIIFIDFNQMFSMNQSIQFNQSIQIQILFIHSFIHTYSKLTSHVDHFDHILIVLLCPC